MLGRTLLILTLILWIAGCGCPQETVAPPPAKAWKQDPLTSTPTSQEEEPADEPHEPHRSGNDEHDPDDSEDEPADANDPAGADTEAPSAVDSEDPSGARAYNTGDCDEWSSYELPLVIEIEIPEFPEEVTGLAEPIPDEEE